MKVRLGELLVRNGVLTPDQVNFVLREQESTGRPFGLICEEHLDISSEAIEEAWALQYASIARTVDPAAEMYDDAVKDLITRRQAWQFRVVPVRFDDRELMVITTTGHLRRALRFATNVIGIPVYLVLASPEDLGKALCQRYPLAGMTPASVLDDGLDRLMELCRPEQRHRASA